LLDPFFIPNIPGVGLKQTLGMLGCAECGYVCSEESWCSYKLSTRGQHLQAVMPSILLQ